MGDSEADSQSERAKCLCALAIADNLTLWISLSVSIVRESLLLRRHTKHTQQLRKRIEPATIRGISQEEEELAVFRSPKDTEERYKKDKKRNFIILSRYKINFVFHVCIISMLPITCIYKYLKHFIGITLYLC